MDKIKDNQKIKITNMTNGRVVVNIPDLRLRRVWERKGAVKTIDFETLEAAKYDIGMESLLKEGILYIEDMGVKKALELEPEDATEPQNIIVLNDNERKELLEGGRKELIQKLKVLSKEQKLALADYAVANEYTDIGLNDILKRETGIDVMDSVRLTRAANEKSEEIKKSEE